MIPVELQSGLKERIEEAFSGTLFKNPDGERVSLNVFEQNLPQKSKDDISFFPFVIIKLMEGEKKTELSEHMARVGFVIGVFDEDIENQGYRDVAMIINKIIEDISKKPQINRQFDFSFPLKWRIHEEETDPYYWGVVETNWSLPVFLREDVEAFI
ncbi:hypothetical protein CD798_08475 [Bacillaceae bacterium SAOS 7]|nr:hypothetical protein CD798_08475 [Bacillaceae bacterium SAOS 7]